MICESCLYAALDESGIDDEGDEEYGRMICRDMGADLADHECEGDGCTCACRLSWQALSARVARPRRVRGA